MIYTKNTIGTTIFLLLFSFTKIFGDGPNFSEFKAVRNIKLIGQTISDTESHLLDSSNYKFGNYITDVHEQCHILSSKVYISDGKFHGLYCLNNKSIILKEPNITIEEVSKIIPSKLRGPSYDLYFNKQGPRWNDRPLYLFNEWNSYTAGSICGIELNVDGYKYELLQAVNFTVYCTYATMLNEDKNGGDVQLRNYLRWNTERVMQLQRQVKLQAVTDYMTKVKEEERLINFLKTYYGEEWVNEYVQ